MKKNKDELIRHLTKRQLIELDACTRCGLCVEWCPVVTVTEDYENTPMNKLRQFRNLLHSKYGLKARIFGSKDNEGEFQKFAEYLYKCTTCGRCGAVCPVGIHCQELWVDIRHLMRRYGYGLQEKIDESLSILERVHNPFDMPPEERNDWIPDDANIQEKAELAFFVGCELAYKAKPMAQGAIKLLNAAGIPFTIAKDEYCCGFPLYVLGEKGGEFQTEVKHNVEQLQIKKVKRVAPYCPCCLNVMKHAWPSVAKLPFEIVHLLKIIADAVDTGKLRFTRGSGKKVTYHDPCYLSRGWGDGEVLIEEPRKIIRAIPGTELVEMKHNKRLSLCPGSGGGLRRTNLELSHKMSIPVFREAEETGAEILLTACPAVYERLKMTINEKIYTPKVKLMDILEFASKYV